MIITLAEAKTYLGVSASDSDAVITSLLTAAQEAMEAHCCRNLEETSVTEDLDGEGSQRLRTREPFQALTALYLDSTRAFGAGTQIGNSNFHLARGRDGTAKVIEYLDSYFDDGQKNVRVVYQAGYTAATMPGNIALALKKQVGVLYSNWQRAKQAKDILSSETVDGWTQTWIDKQGLDDEVKELLTPYENWGL